MVADGETVIDAPVPTTVPLHDPLYQFQLAPVPSDPPATLSVVLPPVQMVGDAAEADVAAVEAVFTVTVTLWQTVLLHVPSALT